MSIRIPPMTLRRLRLNARLDQAEAAKRCGVGERTWRYWESGEREIPSGRLFIVAEALSARRRSNMLTCDEVLRAWAEGAKDEAVILR